ncbi:hypothetical protein VE03_01532 [Pseudogymnoascus sp. 23342-1-I1]|nr:hypothetical protein VE03_01532 [Pseudogymnoascus sp. 23342-1-I1]
MSRPNARLGHKSKIFAIILAILVGCAITAGGTYGIALDIEKSVTKYRDFQNTLNRGYWIHLARLKYNVCYEGCNDCDDPSYARKACAETEKISVTGVTCDANVMRNWDNRYPTACLEALAGIYKRNDLRRAKRDYSGLFVLEIFVVIGGIVGGWVAFYVFECCIDMCKSIRKPQALRRISAWPRENQQKPAPPPPSTTWKASPTPPPYKAASEEQPTPPT